MDDLLLDQAGLRAAARRLGDVLAGYEETLASRPVRPALDRAVIRSILDEPLPEHGRPVDALFDELEDVIVPSSTQVAHPRFLAYVLASPASIAPFAEAVAATLNQNCNVWTISPAANAVEQKVIAWFRELFGIQGGGGIVTSGGSAAILRLGASSVRRIAVDDRFRIARYMGERIEAEPAFELLAPVDLTAVCFRARDLDDAGNARVLDALVASGLAFLGPARVRGRLCLRACFTNLRTSRADVDAIVDEVARLSRAAS